MKVQTVISNQERLVVIRLPGKVQPKAKNGHVQLGETITLKPGTNFIPVAQWAEAKKNEIVLILLEEIIQPLPASMAMGGANAERVGRPKIEVTDVVDDEHPLAELSVQGAVDMVRETLDVNTLQLWQKDEGRSDVRKAIEVQMTQLVPPKDGKAVAQVKHSRRAKEAAAKAAE